VFPVRYALNLYALLRINPVVKDMQILCFWTISFVLLLCKNHNVSQTGFCLQRYGLALSSKAK
jgi:hypothetical protein